MIIDLPSTTSAAINKKMVEMREQGGANAQGRVLTLVIVTDEDSSEDPIAAANGASFEHPCRVIVVAKGSRRGTPRLDAQIRVGGDAGASEVIVLRLFGQLAEHGAAVVIPLLLPDAPLVAWWPGESPDSPAEDPIGSLAQRRITDAAAVKRPITALATRRGTYRPGDTDLAWTRLTIWRGLLAAALDQPPHEKITSATVAGASDSASADLLAGWLALQLRCPVRRIKVDRAGSGLRAVTLTRRSGEVSLVRPEGVTATLSVANQAPRQLTLPRRNLRDCIAEELRRLDADDVYAAVLSKGLDLVAKTAAAESTSSAAAANEKAVRQTRSRLAHAADPKTAAAALTSVSKQRGTSQTARGRSGSEDPAAATPEQSARDARRSAAKALDPATAGVKKPTAQQKSPAARTSPAGSTTAGSPKAGSPKAGPPTAGSPKAGSPKSRSPRTGTGTERTTTAGTTSTKATSTKATRTRATRTRETNAGPDGKTAGPRRRSPSSAPVEPSSSAGRSLDDGHTAATAPAVPAVAEAGA